MPTIKGQCLEIFYFMFFRETVSPGPLRILLTKYRIFASKIPQVMEGSLFFTGVIDTSDQRKKFIYKRNIFFVVCSKLVTISTYAGGITRPVSITPALN